jgi:small-conductance mechanosensitive channel
MDRIIIDLSKGELDFVREALVTKHINLMSYLKTCEEDVQSAEEEIEKEIKEYFAENTVQKPKKPFVFKRKAPFGLKKDGTPKAKPGRKV